MRLKDLLVEELKRRGINCISFRTAKAFKYDPIQFAALMIANGKMNICEGEGKYKFDLEGNEVDECNFVLDRCEGIIDRESLLKKADDFPYIAIDCRYHHLHSEKEFKSLIIQIKETLNVVREYMWDERLVVAGLKTDTNALHVDKLEDFLRDKKKIILLDPNAEDVFEGEKAEVYIIGGIVDKSGNKKGLTSKLGEELRREGIEFESKKILLRGDVIGVPDRLNHIAEIVLKVVLDGKSVEEAIREVQPRKVAKWRLRIELPKFVERIEIRGKKFRIVRKSVISKFDWLNITEEDFYEVASEQGVIVVDDHFRVSDNS